MVAGVAGVGTVEAVGGLLAAHAVLDHPVAVVVAHGGVVVLILITEHQRETAGEVIGEGGGQLAVGNGGRIVVHRQGIGGVVALVAVGGLHEQTTVADFHSGVAVGHGPVFGRLHRHGVLLQALLHGGLVGLCGGSFLGGLLRGRSLSFRSRGGFRGRSGFGSRSFFGRSGGLGSRSGLHRRLAARRLVLCQCGQRGRSGGGDQDACAEQDRQGPAAQIVGLTVFSPP